MTRRTTLRTAMAWLLGVAGCAPAASGGAQVPPAAPPSRTIVGDTLDATWVPAGFGSLRQDDIAVRVAPVNGLQVRAIPLDERIIRLLSPDSYRTLRELRDGKAAAIEDVASRQRLPAYSLWLVSFFAVEQGETRFSPMELIISNVGRDFRPLDVIPLTPGFGEYRLRQREVQSAIFVFDGQLDVNQPLAAQLESARSVTDWAAVVRRIERERALVRSRAAAAKRDTTAGH
jgi:hypothetical protein